MPAASTTSGQPGSLTATMHIKDQHKDGRTSGYDVEIAETICERLVNGESLRAICADPSMPARATVFRWLARNPGISPLVRFRAPVSR
jgi:hypothetical protein